MKKIVIVLGIVGLLLAGCSNKVDNTGKSNTKDSNAVVTSTSNSSSTKDGESSDSQEVTDGKLLKVGQWKKDANDSTGKVELLGITTANEPIQLGDIQILIEDLKVLKMSDYSDPAASHYQNSEQYMDSEKNFYTLQVTFKVINNTENDYGYNGLEYAILNNGQQIDFSADDIAYSMSTSEFFKKTESKDFFRIAYLDPSKVNDLKTVTIKTGDLYNNTDYSTVAESAEKTFNITVTNK